MEFLIVVAVIWAVSHYLKSDETKKQKYKNDLARLYKSIQEQSASKGSQSSQKHQKTYETPSDLSSHIERNHGLGIPHKKSTPAYRYHEPAVIRPHRWFGPNDIDL